MLPVPIIRGELDRHELRIIRTKPSLPAIVVYAAYHEDRIPGDGGVVLEAIKRVLIEQRFLI